MRFVKACKARFESFYEKASKKLIGDDVGKGYDCLCNLFFDFEQGLTSIKSENFDEILKLNNVINAADVFYLLALPKMCLYENICRGKLLLKPSYNAFLWEYKISIGTENYPQIDS